MAKYVRFSRRDIVFICGARIPQVPEAADPSVRSEAIEVERVSSAARAPERPARDGQIKGHGIELSPCRPCPIEGPDNEIDVCICRGTGRTGCAGPDRQCR